MEDKLPELGGSHKLVLKNKGIYIYIYIIFFKKNLGGFFVSFLIIIINDERSKLINDGK